MNDLIRAWTTLPNLHPAVVHFALAWVPLAVALEGAGLIWVRWRDSLVPWATAAWVIAALATGAAYWAGRQAAATMTHLPPDLIAAINTHADWAWRTVWTVGIVAVLRLGVWLRTAWRRRAWVGVVFLGLGAVCLGLLVKTADLGGGLVYERGIGVAPAAAARQAAEEARAQALAFTGASADRALERFVEQGQGFLWRPAPGDAAALGTILEHAPGSDPATVSVAPAPSGEQGLTLAISGEAFLLFPGSPGEVQLSATLGVEEFRGTVALIHHYQGPDNFEALAVRVPQGEFTLAQQSPEGKTIYDRATTSLPDSTLELGVSAIGRHLRGTLGEALIVHGHREAGGGGRVGLRLAGNGTLRIRTVRAQTTSDTDH